MNIRYYLAYGSNLHPCRLIKRGLTVKHIGTVELNDTKLVFHKRSIDYSGKCMIAIDDKNHSVSYGALYEIDAKEEPILDAAEGYGNGYTKKFVNCPIDGVDYKAFTYAAISSAIDESLKPYHWYKKLVIIGATYHGFPEDYISLLENIESIEDPDNIRRLSNETLLEEIKMF